jgi:hypothetical protein
MRSQTPSLSSGVATRYEKRAVNYQALVVLASIAIWLDS